MVRTRVIKVDPQRPDPQVVKEAASVILRGGLVAFPTETVYGLGANALDARAVEGIFRAKGRPPDNPLIVHVSRPEMLARLVTSVPSPAEKLINRFWPGPLTLLFPRSEQVPDVVTAGLPTVAVRMPDHPVSHLLIDTCGVPVAAPSANVSGKPSPTNASDVLEDLDGKIDLVLDGGECDIGVESTVLDLVSPTPRILRPGGVSKEEIEETLGVPVEVTSGRVPEEEIPASPGMKYRHYAPAADMYIVLGDPPSQVEAALYHAGRFLQDGSTVVVLSSSETYPEYGALKERFPASFHAIDLGPREDIAKVAANLFAAMRMADRLGADVIISETFEEKGLGLAVYNRLYKASGGKTLRKETPAGVEGQRPLNVAFVCTGNTCRSPMAEVLFRRAWDARNRGKPVQVISRGIAAAPGSPATPEAREAVARRGLDLSGHQSMPLSAEDVEASDILITMTRDQKERLLRRFPGAAGKTFTVSEIASSVTGDVADPIGFGQKAYEETAALLEKAVEQIVEHLSSYRRGCPGNGAGSEGGCTGS